MSITKYHKKREHSALSGCESGDRSGIRTRDPLIKSHQTIQLDQDRCDTRSPSVHDGVLRVTEQSITNHNVYMAICREHIKIGVAANTEKRISTLQSGSPFYIQLLRKYSVPKKDAKRIEGETHILLEKHHTRGEWFKCNEDTAVNAIESAIIQISGDYYLDYDIPGDLKYLQRLCRR